ncbi:MAG: PPC domain-containing DNA-binding protein [Candidatus Omnitrophota bacterium]|nr:PPC domain-containing DNA-binding protein [Candidatus Omnitrophota bacterium]
MQYSQASIGRVFIIKVEHKEDLLEEIKKLAIRENIEFATLAFIGAMTRADIVAGPGKLELPAVPAWISFGDGREVLGFGTIVKNGEEVNAHIHASFGKGDKALTGCLEPIS